MRGLKLLYRRSLGKWVALMICGAMLIAISVCAVVFNEELGSEDYIFVKVSMMYPAAFYMMLTTIFTNVDIAGSRCLRASAIAKELYTVSVPLYCTLTSFAFIAVPTVVYITAMTIQNAPSSSIGDALIMAAFALLFLSIISVLGCVTRYGMIIAIYSFAPMAVCVFAMPGSWKEYGFGLSAPISAVIFAGAAVLTFAASFAIARLLYFKFDFKVSNLTNSQGFR